MGVGLVYVSITGIRVKGPTQLVPFWWHASRSMAQAQRAPGNLRAEARMIDGIHHTLSVWETEAAMRRYLVSGAHGRAMRAFAGIGSGKTLGFETDRVPDWSEVHALWQTRGREVQAPVPRGEGPVRRGRRGRPV